jgi:hypothetical protein
VPDASDGAAFAASDAATDVAPGAADVSTDVAIERAREAGPEVATPLDAPAEAVAPDAYPSSCADNRKNGFETDIDCGGPACPKCGLGQGCLADSDCGTWPGCDNKKGGCTCDAVAHACVADHCLDHKQDVGESAVDCGGGECAGCAVGVACVLHSDCASRACDNLAKTCATNHCSDHVFDSSETDLDCGGGSPCPACPVGAMCLLDFDCASKACDGVTGMCVADPCADHQVDGSETDLDCGGADCARCGVGRKCKASSDCAAGLTCSSAPGYPSVCEP